MMIALLSLIAIGVAFVYRFSFIFRVLFETIAGIFQNNTQERKKRIIEGCKNQELHSSVDNGKSKKRAFDRLDIQEESIRPRPYRVGSVKKWAILVSGSRYWNNYRHQADVCNAYQILKKRGFDDKNIVVFTFDDIAYNGRNPYEGVIFNKLGGPNVYDGVPKDYTGKYTTARNFYNVLLGNKSGLKGGSGKVLESGPNDRVFIYYSGHGLTKRLCMPGENDYVDAETFINILKRMHRNKLYGEMVIYVEACRSGSIFQSLLPTDINVYAMTSSDEENVCHSGEIDRVLDAAYDNIFSMLWMYDSEHNDSGRRTLADQFKWVKKSAAKYGVWSAPVNRYGTMRLERRYVRDFI